MLSTCQSHVAIKDGVQVWTLAAWEILYSFCYVTQTEMLPNPGEVIMPNMGVQGGPRILPCNGSHPLQKALLVQLNIQHTKATIVVEGGGVWRLMSMWLSLRCGTPWGSLGNQLQLCLWSHKRGQKPWLREAPWAVMELVVCADPPGREGG